MDLDGAVSPMSGPSDIVYDNFDLPLKYGVCYILYAMFLSLTARKPVRQFIHCFEQALKKRFIQVRY